MNVVCFHEHSSLTAVQDPRDQEDKACWTWAARESRIYELGFFLYIPPTSLSDHVD